MNRTRRFLIAVDVDAEALDLDDCTFDDVRDGLAARLTAFYPGPGETEAALVACAEVTEGLDLLIAAAGVGLEGFEPDGGPYTEREADDAWTALARLEQDLNGTVSAAVLAYENGA